MNLLEEFDGEDPIVQEEIDNAVDLGQSILMTINHNAFNPYATKNINDKALKIDSTYKVLQLLNVVVTDPTTFPENLGNECFNRHNAYVLAEALSTYPLQTDLYYLGSLNHSPVFDSDSDVVKAILNVVQQYFMLRLTNSFRFNLYNEEEDVEDANDLLQCINYIFNNPHKYRYQAFQIVDELEI